MDHQTAVRLITDTFSHSFDEKRFKGFILELFNHLDDSKAFSYAGQYIPNAFKESVRQYKRLGTYIDPDGLEVDVIIVYLHRESALDHARTMQRNFITHYLKQRGQKETAVVAFVGESPDDWRFSLVRMDYRTNQTETGRVTITEELTPARRYSFLVGKNEPNHTAMQQLLPILEDSHRDPTLTQLETAFNIESITKEFFEKYKSLFLQLKEELDTIAAKDAVIHAEFDRCKIDTTAFAKKLLGQIVFLYFLQKKGWLGVQPGKDWGTGSRNFLFDLFQYKHSPYQNFFNDLLEPLFYEALAIERIDNFYPRLNCKIPFLNGGLFEPISEYDWQKTSLLIKNETFKEIFETFNLYNFTVREDEPLEREVAVDPEMLGKVFENLLDVKDRKSKGAFYTPREIVHFMCQESLINYLDTILNQEKPTSVSDTPKPNNQAKDDCIDREDIEIFIRHGEIAADYDAAKEGGTIGYKWKLAESIRSNAAEIDQALADIKICDPAIGSGAFPVGIMGEIIKARSVLSTYLSADSSRSAYVFKRNAIENSIYGVDIDASAVDIARLRLWLSLVVDEEDFQTIKPLPNLDYKIVCGNSLQGFKHGYLAGEVEAKKNAFTNTTDPIEKQKLKAEVDNIFKFLTSNYTQFDFKVYFSEVFKQRQGFDIVIANPPYVRQEQFSDQKPFLKKNFFCFTGTSDLYVYFYERGTELLRSGGILTYISSNKYFRSAYGEKLRKSLAAYTIDQLIDFGDAPVFDAIAYPSIIVLRKTHPHEHSLHAFTWQPGQPLERFSEVYFNHRFLLDQKELKAEGWRLELPVNLRLHEKLRKIGQPLGEYVKGKIYRGIITGLNEAYIVDQSTRNRLIDNHPSSAELLKPILRGRDVKRWRIDYADLYIIKIESSENKRHPWTGLEDAQAEACFALTYPAIYAHLNQFRQALIKRDDQGKFFWELRSCKYWGDFDSPQIVWGNLATEPKFSLAPAGYILCAPANTLITNSKYLLGILNSRLTQYLVSQSAAERQGGYVEFKPMYISPLVIPTKPINENISELVAEILVLISANPLADVSALEAKIDSEVYKLYELNEFEISLIENNNSNPKMSFNIETIQA